MVTPESKLPRQISRVLNVISTPFLDALLILHRKLEEENIQWALWGDFAEALKIVKVEPDCIEIVTSENDTETIFKAVQEYKPERNDTKVRRLSRDALVGGVQYPLYVKSRFFEFSINFVRFEVNGDLRYRIDNWEWGDKLEFKPEYVTVVGKKIALVPLSVKFEIYKMIGWEDRAEKIKQAIERPKAQIRE